MSSLRLCSSPSGKYFMFHSCTQPPQSPCMLEPWNLRGLFYSCHGRTGVLHNCLSSRHSAISVGQCWFSSGLCTSELWSVRDAVDAFWLWEWLWAELFQILKDVAEVLHSIPQQIWKTQQWPQDWKKFPFQSQRRVMPKNVQTTVKLHSLFFFFFSGVM